MSRCICFIHRSSVTGVSSIILPSVRYSGDGPLVIRRRRGQNAESRLRRFSRHRSVPWNVLSAGGAGFILSVWRYPHSLSQVDNGATSPASLFSVVFYWRCHPALTPPNALSCPPTRGNRDLEMIALAFNFNVLTRDLSLYLENQVKVGLFGSGVGLSLVLGFSAAYACYYLISVAKVGMSNRCSLLR